MFEFEDMTTGFHDVFLSKYMDSSGPILDLYISDSMQDMLDVDIRSEVATVVGGTNEFTSLLNDLPSLELDSNSNDLDTSWLGGPKWSATSATTGHDFYADVGACVNPSSIMPLITSSLLLNSPNKSQINLNTTSNYQNNFKQHVQQQQQQQQNNFSPPPSPKENKSHLTFSPNQIKVPSSLLEIRKPSQLTIPNNTEINSVKKDLKNIISNNTSLIDGNLINNNNHQRTIQSNQIMNPTILSGSTIKLAPGIGGLTFANNFAYTKLKNINNRNQLNGNIIKRDRDHSPHQQNTNYSVQSQNSKLFSKNILIQQNNKAANSPNNNFKNNNSNSNNNQQQKLKPTGQEFPKPAYSYSCLIAMALKNSRSGSLPVSEIYSFMCEHFPYFKTAPNGWKNSVRHNLSLNKCFEKIEKPATNGGQRKGCLWAMNPSKITKMDEEVQKWSRKDPMAIRKAMVYPQNLEALERGEMKHGSSGDSDGENFDDMEEASSDVEQDINDIEEVETPESLLPTEEEEEQHEQTDRDFEIEVQDIYDAIDLEDDKETIRMAIQQNDMVEYTTDDYLPTPKRARLDINYSIGPATYIKQENHQYIKHDNQTLIKHENVSYSQHSVNQNRRKMQLVNRIA